jgi:hypothetical protein
MTTTDTERAAQLAAQKHADELTHLAATLAKLDEYGKHGMAESLRDALAEAPLSVDTIKTIRVTIGTGGPAYGVDFTVHGATAWHQDWFIERQHVTLDDDTTRMLADAWGIDLDEEFD